MRLQNDPSPLPSPEPAKSGVKPLLSSDQQGLVNKAGLVDPTGIGSAVGAGIHLIDASRGVDGALQDAAEKGVGAIPVLGKFGKLGAAAGALGKLEGAGATGVIQKAILAGKLAGSE